MNILNFEHIYKSFENRLLLNDATFGISDTDKIGVIGINGTGKSTLLSIAADALDPDKGQVIKGRTLKISYLKQNPDFDNKKTILENVVSGISGKSEHWDTVGEAKAMLHRFGIENPDEYPDKLSGGQKKRAALAAALLTPAELLILDEPTNHLDHAMIEFLQSFLKKFQGAVLLVTHDRYFLDEVTDQIIEIDKGNIYRYVANYSKYLELRQQRLDDAKASERKMAALYKKDLAWIQRGARARSTKQKAHIQRFESLRDRDKIVEDREVEIQSLTSRLGGKTIECSDISKSFEGRLLFRNFTYNFGKLDRIGIIGPNGCGKSTLLKIITEKISPDTGSVSIGQTVKIGYFGQENEELPQSGRVIDCVKDIGEYIETREGMVTASRMCETFLFDGNMQYTPVDKLSGGEKRRLYLLQILMAAPNVLVLDEPTNDLDIQTLRVLEDYLDTFAGIVITVSHDRFFLDRVVTRIFSFEPDGTIRQSEGGYEEYWERNFDSVMENRSIPNRAVKSPEQQTHVNRTGTDSENRQQGNRTERKKKKLSYKEQREYDSIESEIDMLQEQSDALEQEMAAMSDQYSRLMELTAEKERTDLEIEAKMERFLELQELVDSFA